MMSIYRQLPPLSEYFQQLFVPLPDFVNRPLVMLKHLCSTGIQRNSGTRPEIAFFLFLKIIIRRFRVLRTREEHQVTQPIDPIVTIFLAPQAVPFKNYWGQVLK